MVTSILGCFAAAVAVVAQQQPSQLIAQVNKDNFVHSLDGFHDPVEINKYSRMSTQIRQYVAFDVFNNFRGLNAEPRGCHARSSGCTAFAGLEQIWGYGCHCYFGSDWKKARGDPSNEVDELCMDLNMCYKCIVMDGEDAGETCSPGYQNYTIPARKDILSKGITHSCFEANAGNLCAQRTCCCDTQLTDGIINLFFAGISFDTQYKHSEGFEPSMNCNPNPTGPKCTAPDCEVKCCGNYPDRYTYKSGRKQCCGESTYNSLTKKCCASTSIVDLLDTC